MSINQNKQKRIIVVLGMHRSGTSVITRSLKVLGVELGNNLMPAVQNVNDKGFWEDMDFFSLNEEILRTLQEREWHSLRPIHQKEFDNKSLTPLKMCAIDLLRTKTTQTPTLGMKDPRFSILLPFWKEIFSFLELDTCYVIAIRNPHSIALSLQKRDGFEFKKSYCLWLNHILPCFVETINQPRIVVNYDQVIAHPEAQLRRISEKLSLPFNTSEFEDFTNNFISLDLRHSECHLKDLKRLADIPSKNVIQTFTILDSMSKDQISTSSQEIHHYFQNSWKELPSLLLECNIIDHT